MLTHRQSLSPCEQLDYWYSSPPQLWHQGACPLDGARFTMENFALTKKSFRILYEEEQMVLEGQDYHPLSDSKEQ